MLEENKPQQPVAPSGPRSKVKWIALAIGGGCSLLACAVVVVTLFINILWPLIRAALYPTSVAQVPVPVLPQSTHTGGTISQGPGNTMGDPNAPVKMVEYADFQCPYCQRYWQETEPQIIDAYVKTGKVYYEYRSVGAFIGPESEAAAQAAYCAGDQGKFWEYRAVLFSHWTGENVGDFSDSHLKQYAASLGLDGSTFDSCLSSGKYSGLIQQDVSHAKADGVQATPSFVINGKLVEGAQPFSVFQQAIEAALQGQ